MGITHCGGTTFRWGERTYVMGIINVSPDSFSGDGLASVDAALAQARCFVAEGVDMLDVGGESTRPGSAPISDGEELRRVIPVLERLADELTLPLVVDTYKLDVVRQALDAGAQMINDIWGLGWEPRLAELAARFIHLEESSQRLEDLDKQLKLKYFRLKHELTDRSMREIFASRLINRRR